MSWLEESKKILQGTFTHTPSVDWGIFFDHIYIYIYLFRYPNGIYVDGMDTSAAVVQQQQQPEDDFFESWSKPSTPKPSSTGGTPARIATPPVLGRAVSSASSTTTTTSTTSTNTPRTINSSSSSIRTSRLGAKSTTSSTSTTSTSTTSSAPKKTKLGGLGAQKAAKGVDFAAAERKAREEEERIRQLGYDREREQAEEETRKKEEALKKSQEIGKMGSSSSTATRSITSTTTKAAAAASNAKQNAAFPRLGFGAIPGAGAAATVSNPTTSTTTSSKAVADDAPTVARERFGNQKAISSDMYFERNDYDPSTVNEGRARLEAFRGATSISSNQYFGRGEDDDEAVAAMERGGGGAVMGDGSLAGLESAAKDAVARLLANPDVQNVGESIRAGALKLSDYLASMNMER